MTSFREQAIRDFSESTGSDEQWVREVIKLDSMEVEVLYGVSQREATLTLEDAMRNIKKHTEVMLGITANRTAIWNIADAALNAVKEVNR